jgi:hypothetical protein
MPIIVVLMTIEGRLGGVFFFSFCVFIGRVIGGLILCRRTRRRRLVIFSYGTCSGNISGLWIITLLVIIIRIIVLLSRWLVLIREGM